MVPAIQHNELQGSHISRRKSIITESLGSQAEENQARRINQRPLKEGHGAEFLQAKAIHQFKGDRLRVAGTNHRDEAALATQH